jgi:phosphatidate cytidylyltransferase
MAFNWPVFKTRALTAVIFVLVMAAGLFWNHWSFLLLFSIIHFGCWWEYLKLTEKIHNSIFHPYTKLGLMLIGYGIMLWFCEGIYHINNYGLRDNISLPVSASGFALLIFGVFQKNTLSLKPMGMAMLGLVYISLPWGLMMDLFQIKFSSREGDVFYHHSEILPPVVIFSIWINDTMAYIVGSLIGKTPLSKISPKKTWEGTIGGIILAVVVMGFINLYVFHLNHFPPAINWFMIPAIAAISGTFGDLLESKLKRMAGVKDSGSIMPGHGGFLDRFDSLLVAIPFVWAFLHFFVLSSH